MKDNVAQDYIKWMAAAELSQSDHSVSRSDSFNGDYGNCDRPPCPIQTDVIDSNLLVICLTFPVIGFICETPLDV